MQALCICLLRCRRGGVGDGGGGGDDDDAVRVSVAFQPPIAGCT